jgi:hypothetical protein
MKCLDLERVPDTALPISEYKVATRRDSWGAILRHGGAQIGVQRAFAPAGAQFLCLNRHKPRQNTAETMAGLRDEHGCTAKGMPLRHVLGGHLLMRPQVLTQDLEQADPTVYSIIENVGTTSARARSMPG